MNLSRNLRNEYFEFDWILASWLIKMMEEDEDDEK